MTKLSVTYLIVVGATQFLLCRD